LSVCRAFYLHCRALFGLSVAERPSRSRLTWEPSVARYFMHLRDSIDELLDPEGIEMPADAIAGAALMAARDVIAGDVRSGRIDLHFRIDVHDEAGEVVHTLPFADAVEVLPK